MPFIELVTIQENDYDDLVLMVGELLAEIMDKTQVQAFHFDAVETKSRAKKLVDANKYWIFVAKDIRLQRNIGFISLYESYALYAEGAYGTIAELYVYPEYRSKKIGTLLLRKVFDFGVTQCWSRLEVTTPKLPEFERTLLFYEQNGFSLSGGRKLKIDVPAQASH